MSKIKLVKENPRFILARINSLLTYINQKFHQRFVSKSSFDMMSADWDNLLILDACRYDEFVSIADLPGETEAKISPGSISLEWYEESINGHELFDTVCVSANPYTHDFASQFHDADLLYSDEYWDTELCTVPPETVAERARVMADKHPDKRLLIHFMQPHFPPIGPSREELPVSGNPPDGVTTDKSHFGVQTHLNGQVDGVTDEKALKGYRENLEIVLETVSSLLNDLDGKTVISADHGELFGERLYPIPVRGTLHSSYIRVDPLITVPWHIVPFESRRETTTEEPEEGQESFDDDLIESRLTALGYREE